MTSNNRAVLTKELDDALVTLDYLLFVNNMNKIDVKKFRMDQIDRQLNKMKELVYKAQNYLHS